MVLPSASSRNLVSSTQLAPLMHLTSTCTSPSGPIVISNSFFSAICRFAPNAVCRSAGPWGRTLNSLVRSLLPLTDGELHRAVLLHRVLIDRVALLFDGGDHTLIGVLGVELLDDLFFLEALGRLHAPPIGLERVGAVGLLDHADVVLAHVDGDLGLRGLAALAAHLDALLAVFVFPAELIERLPQRDEVVDLRRYLREMRHGYTSTLKRSRFAVGSRCTDAGRARVLAHSRMLSMPSFMVTASGTISRADETSPSLPRSTPPSNAS